MKRLSKTFITLILFVLGLLLLNGCSGNQLNASGNHELVKVSVERTGGVISGIGNVKVYIDDKEVMKVKNKQTKSVELLLSPGIHTIQTKGQGDKSKVVKFEVVAGEDNHFSYQTEISSFYGLSLQRVK